MATTKDDWYIKHMPATNQARRKITAFASLNNITIPAAIDEIIKKAKI
jgi:hypothetical protein